MSLLQPLRQGNLDALCGIYAIINALTIARSTTAPLGEREQLQLFEAAMFKLVKTHDMPSVMRYGLSWKLLRRLSKHLIVKASGPTGRMHGQRLPKLLTSLERRDWLAGQLAAGRPIVVLLQPHAHYSVVIGHSPKSFRLFDSNGRCRVATHAVTKALAIATEVAIGPVSSAGTAASAFT